MRTRRDIFHIAAAISIVVMLVISPTMIGKAYSVEYTGQVSNTENNVTADYFTMGLFSYNPDTNSNTHAPTGAVVPYIDDKKADEYNADLFTAKKTPFDKGRVAYNLNEDGTCEITDKETELTDGNLYLRIIETTSNNNKYEINCEIKELYNPSMKGQHNLLKKGSVIRV